MLPQTSIHNKDGLFLREEKERGGKGETEGEKMGGEGKRRGNFAPPTEKIVPTPMPVSLIARTNW